MANSKKDTDLPGRRGFLKGAAAGGIGTLAIGTGAIAAPQVAAPPAPKMGPGPAEGDPVSQVEVLTTDRPGSDFMVDVLKSLGFEYAAANPGSSFRSLHESLINYGGNRSPELLTCCHEESSVGMAHGYANVEGKPMLVMAHSTVGLQHAAMNIYNAWVGRVPVFLVLGNTLDATMRRPGVEWKHSAQDAAAIVRDFTKWDDNPVSLPHFAESAVRAYKISMALPREPLVLVADSELQERPVPKDANLRIPKLSLDAPPWGDAGSVAEVARLLVTAENPVVIAGGATRSQQGMERFIEFVEALQVPVVDQESNLPSRHPLITSRAALRNADVILGLEVEDFWGMLNTVRDQQERTFRSATRPGVKVLNISIAESPLRTNYQDFQRYQEFDLSITADAEATLPVLIEAVNRLLTSNHRTAFQNRGKMLAEARQRAIERERVEATYGLEFQSYQPGAPVGRGVGASEERGLGRRTRTRKFSVGLRKVLPIRSLSERAGVRRPIARRRGGCPRASEARKTLRELPERRRPDVCARCAVDGRAPPHSLALRDAQQPRLSPGGDAHPDHGQPARAWHF